eukprot:GHVN01104351.1.p1 GENE.GHVN01104351.1~~GHVN01104351.1.p1  ORF type:complete len:324 (-),score=57.78 GHVN01104351.1:1119-2090(-)
MASGEEDSHRTKLATDSVEVNPDAAGETEANTAMALQNPPKMVEQLDKAIVQRLLELEIAAIRAEKAVYFSQNQGFEPAMLWLSDHQDDADIDNPISESDVEPPMSKEEAEKKALELQDRLHKKRMETEKLEAREREKKRIESTKIMQDVQRKAEEEQRQRDIQDMKKEKSIHDAESERLKAILRREHHEKFGPDVPFPGDMKEEVSAFNVKNKSEKEQVIFWVNTMSHNYKKEDPQGLATCLGTLILYITNAKDHPLEKKYHRIRKGNAAFASKVQPFEGALQLLDAVGFKDTGEFVEIQGDVNGFMMGQAIRFLDFLKRQL